MHKQKCLLDRVRVTVLSTVLVCSFIAGSCCQTFAQETSEEKTEVIAGKVYQFENDESYDISSTDGVSTVDSAKEDKGQFSITGNISSVTERNGFPAYSVRGGTLAFSYAVNNAFLKAPKDEEHLVSDSGKRINSVSLPSEINKGAMIIQTSKDGQIWFNVLDSSVTNLFGDNPNGLKAFYTTTDVQMVNGCYYRVLIAYKTAIRTQKAQKFPPKLEKYRFKKYVEAYSFYAYDETAETIAVPESKSRRNLGSKVRVIKEGYADSVTMDNDDPHFGWEMGQFFVGGFTDYEVGDDENPIFLKNNGDRLSLWFELQQDIDKCYGNDAIKVIADPEGSDAYFEFPGGVNETTDFGRGALIIRKTNPDGTKERVQVYTNYLEASASTDAVTKVGLFEEGDYEVALDYAVKFDKTHIFGKSILPEIAKYRIFFKFSVRNGNSMVFLFDKESGSELSSGAITENGFRIDFANSKYLRVNVKREILKDGFDGLTEDTRFNSLAADGDVFTDEGVYTVTVTNRALKNSNPTEKKVYVGTNNILKAYMVNGIPISEIKERVALGATINDDGTIIEPELESDLAVSSNTTQVNDEQEFEGESETDTVQDAEDASADSMAQEGSEAASENDDSEAQTGKRDYPAIPIIIAIAVATVGGALFRSYKKGSK